MTFILICLKINRNSTLTNVDENQSLSQNWKETGRGKMEES